MLSQLWLKGTFPDAKLLGEDEPAFNTPLHSPFSPNIFLLKDIHVSLTVNLLVFLFMVDFVSVKNQEALLSLSFTHTCQDTLPVLFRAGMSVAAVTVTARRCSPDSYSNATSSVPYFPSSSGSYPAGRGGTEVS